MRSTAFLLKPASEPLCEDPFPIYFSGRSVAKKRYSVEVFIPVTSIACSFPATVFRLYIFAQAVKISVGASQASILVD